MKQLIELPWFPRTAEVLGRLEQFEHPKYLPAMAAIRAFLWPDGYVPTEDELERYHARSSYEAELATATRDMAGVKQAVDRWLRSGDRSPLSSDWGDPLKYSLKAVREWIAVNGPEAVRFVKRSEEAFEAETRLRRLVRNVSGVIDPRVPDDLRKEVEGTWRRSDDPEGYLSTAVALEQRVLQAIGVDNR